MASKIELGAKTHLYAIDPDKGFGTVAGSDKLRFSADHDTAVRNLARLVLANYEAGGSVTLYHDEHEVPGTPIKLADGRVVVDERAVEHFKTWGLHNIRGSKDWEFDAAIQ